MVANLHHFDEGRIRIRIKVKNSDPDPHKREKWYPNLHYSEKSDPATRKVRQQQLISTYFTGLLAMIRINVMQIRNTACQTKKKLYQ